MVRIGHKSFKFTHSTTSMMRKISPPLFSMFLDNFYDIPEFFQLFFRAILLQFFQLFLVQELVLI